ncbi:MAG: EVE domain-containing protein [Bacteroidales bacterium]|nr:EVE domain-containing protein [Bacteroidales bacterium]
MDNKIEKERNYWIFPYKSADFDVEACLKKHNRILWHLTSNTEKPNLKKGDFVFLYDCAPISKITFLMKVVVPYLENPVPPYNENKFWRNEKAKKETIAKYKHSCLLEIIEEINSIDLTYKRIKQIDNSFSVQGQHRIGGKALEYILNVANAIIDECLECNDSRLLTEGKVSRCTLVKYERNINARQECIDKKGCKCAVCDMDFEKVYGELGKGFIHVHHVVPVSERGGVYEIDSAKDLVPVCPNCHAMLHRKGTITVEKLREIIAKNKK